MLNIIIILLVGGVAVGVFLVFLTANRIFVNTLYRSDKKPRSRDISDPSYVDLKRMHDQGRAWAEKNKDKAVELHIVNDGLNLYGEYFDFGYDKCAVIIQGRTESLLFSCFFADLYADNGYNVFVMDIRAHGMSDGKYITAGIQEHRDIIVWIELIKSKFSIESFVIHGMCIGAAAAIYTHCAMKKENLIKKLVLDGAYTDYYEMFKNHMIERKKPIFCFVYLTFFYTRLLEGTNLLKMTPYKRAGEIDIPVLFLWSVEDPYCFKEKNEALFAACKSEGKAMKLFPIGGHSYVRLLNKADYDKTVVEFLSGNCD